MPRFFRCARTGLLYPADYVENWGRKYGIGLGPEPVSEALVNNYGGDIAINRDNMLSMRPVAVCKAQVDLVDIPDKSPELKRMAILAIDDPHMDERAQVMRERQREHDPKMRRIYEDEKAFRAKVNVN